VTGVVLSSARNGSVCELSATGVLSKAEVGGAQAGGMMIVSTINGC
jgi:hypothetical protein